MKICLFTHTLNPRTGAGEFSGNLIDNARDLHSGINFTILTSEDLLPPKFWKFLFNFRQIRKKIKESDVIHALDTYPYGVMALVANAFINKPLIITAVGSGSVRFIKYQGFKSFLLRLAYRKADKVTAISSYIANQLKGWVSGLEVEIINHGVDTRFWSESKEFNIDPLIMKAKPYILTVGEMKERKGYSESVSVFYETLKSFPELKYIIVAREDRNNEYWNVVNRQIKDLRIEDSIFFLSNL